MCDGCDSREVAFVVPTRRPSSVCAITYCRACGEAQRGEVAELVAIEGAW